MPYQATAACLPAPEISLAGCLLVLTCGTHRWLASFEMTGHEVDRDKMHCHVCARKAALKAAPAPRTRSRGAIVQTPLSSQLYSTTTRFI